MESLAGALRDKGWVSVAEAAAFVDRERAERAAAGNAPPPAPRRAENDGAALLLARAERDLPGTLARFQENAIAWSQAGRGAWRLTRRASKKAIGLAAGQIQALGKAR